MSAKGLFRSFLLGGFECSTHKLKSGRRLDLLASTGHDRFAAADYARLASLGVRTVREGIRWHLIDRGGRLDFSSALPLLRAAEASGVEAIWDIFHFGWPDDIDVYSAEFVRRYARLAREFAKVLLDHTSGTAFIAPSNEISFVAWAGGEAEYLNPFSKGRGWELKRQLARAAIEAIGEIRAVSPAIRLAHPEPAIHLTGRPGVAGDDVEAEHYRQFQFQAWDLIAGRLEPELGGREEYLDILGLNFYDRNQWVHHGPTLTRFDARYRPFSEMLRETYERYRRPLFVAETGMENGGRPAWLAYVCAETRAALAAGVPVEGICWYPIADHLGWDNDRECHNGLLEFANERGERRLYEPLAKEWRRQTARFEGRTKEEAKRDLVCFSHLRWNFVYQRPQHLMSRFARARRVFFFEEPVYEEPAGKGRPAAPRLEVRVCAESGVHVAAPVLPAGMPQAEAERAQAALLRRMLRDHEIEGFTAWFYSPMMLPLADGLRPEATVYDCMDELSLFQGAPRELLPREAALLEQADVVFTGGYSLYEAKRERHGNAHPFPSSVDVEHFRAARLGGPEPADQAGIGRPRLGYCGVIDERLDLELIEAVARLRPEWNLVMVGPVVKIDRASLPRLPNIHYLGGKTYAELPGYLGGWDAALMPFARNDATRFISPTKTPEYLAAGRPVISTPVRDVARAYGGGGLVRMAETAEEFVAAAEAAMAFDRDSAAWLARVDEALAGMSWERTFERMDELIQGATRKAHREGSGGREQEGTACLISNSIT